MGGICSCFGDANNHQFLASNSDTESNIRDSIITKPTRDITPPEPTRHIASPEPTRDITPPEPTSDITPPEQTLNIAPPESNLNIAPLHPTPDSVTPVHTFVQKNPLPSLPVPLLPFRKSSEGRLVRFPSISTGSSSVEVLDLETDEPLELFPRGSSASGNINTNPTPIPEVRPRTSPASTVSSPDDDVGIILSTDEMKEELRMEDENDNHEAASIVSSPDDDVRVILSTDDVKKELRMQHGNEVHEGETNDNKTVIDMKRVFVAVDSKLKLEDLQVSENMEQDDILADRRKSPNFETSDYDSLPRLSVDMAVKYFHELGQQSSFERRTPINATDRARDHVRKASPRIASAAQKFGEMADHMW